MPRISDLRTVSSPVRVRSSYARPPDPFRDRPAALYALASSSRVDHAEISLLFSPTGRRTPGPKGPHPDVIAAVVAMKQRNPTWGCPRIAQQIALAFGIYVNKDVVLRILAARYQSGPGAAGPSWLTTFGHARDSLWSLDLFRCESATLRTYWVLVMMNPWTRRIVGFGVHGGVVDGAALCRMFNRATRGQPLPTYLSADHDPLYRFHLWQANFGSSTSRKSRRCRMCRGPIPSSNG